jgi:hypothetical protein
MRASSWCIASDMPCAELLFSMSVGGGEEAGVDCSGDGFALAAEGVISKLHARYMRPEISVVRIPKMRICSRLAPGARRWRAMDSILE